MVERRRSGGSHGGKPWRPAEATRRIREKVQTGDIELFYTQHAKERMSERGLLISDVTHVLRNGTVYEEAEPAEGRPLQIRD